MTGEQAENAALGHASDRHHRFQHACGMLRIRWLRQVRWQINQAIVFQGVRAGKCNSGHVRQPHPLVEMAEVIVNGERRRGENPRLITGSE